MDADIISGTASAGTIGMPVGAPFGLKLLIPTHTVFDLTSKYVEIRLRQEGGTGPILYTATTDGSYGSITDGGTADQYVEFNIPTATVSEHDSATTLASLAKAGRKYDFAVDIKTSAASDTALRVQGELHWIVAEGEYSTSATTGSSLTVNVSSGSATVTLSVAAAGAQGPQGEKGDKGDTGDSGSGTVSSVAISGSDGIEVDSGSPITTTGTIALGVDAAALRTHINVEDGADVTDTANVGSAINAATGKTPPVDADSVGLIDSAASNVLKKLTWANIKATLKTYFDTVYAAALGADDNYVTDAEKVVIGNTSGTNTGDQDLSTYQLKPSEGSFVDGDKTKLDDLGGAAGGTTGQIATKASNSDYDLAWSDDLTVPGLLTADHIHGNVAGTLYIHVKNTSGGTLAKGTPVYVTGHVGSSDRVEVAAADQSDLAKMPAIALLAQELENNGEGDGVIVGEIRTYDTDTPGWALNDELFVGTSGLTTTRPTTGSVQPVATVGRIQASTGVLVINCQGQRTPDESFADAAHSHTLSDITDAGTAAANDTGDFATAAQGTLADSALQSGDIDTLAELNAIVTDATLIDTTDSRLSDSRTCDNTFDDAATARTNLGVDPAGTDNSTDVTLAAGLDYLSLSGQEITLGSVDLTTDVTGTLPAANGGTGVTALSSLDAASLGAGASSDGQVLTSDGAGGAAWEDAGGGGISTGKAIAMAIVFG